MQTPRSVILIRMCNIVPVVTERHAVDGNRTDLILHTTPTQYIQHRQEVDYSNVPMECNYRMRMNNALISIHYT